MSAQMLGRPDPPGTTASSDPRQAQPGQGLHMRGRFSAREISGESHSDGTYLAAKDVPHPQEVSEFGLSVTAKDERTISWT